MAAVVFLYQWHWRESQKIHFPNLEWKERYLQSCKIYVPPPEAREIDYEGLIEVFNCKMCLKLHKEEMSFQMPKRKETQLIS